MAVMELFDPWGTAPGSSLSWSQHDALLSMAKTSKATERNTAAATAGVWAAGIEVGRVRRAVDAIGVRVEDVCEAVTSMEYQLGLRLDVLPSVLVNAAGGGPVAE